MAPEKKTKDIEAWQHLGSNYPVARFPSLRRSLPTAQLSSIGPPATARRSSLSDQRGAEKERGELENFNRANLRMCEKMRGSGAIYRLKRSVWNVGCDDLDASVPEKRTPSCFHDLKVEDDGIFAKPPGSGGVMC